MIIEKILWELVRVRGKLNETESMTLTETHIKVSQWEFREYFNLSHLNHYRLIHDSR